MIACDNEGGCPYEWVRYSVYVSALVLLFTSLPVSVPSRLRRSQAAHTREVVLLCLYQNRQRRRCRNDHRSAKEGQEEVVLLCFTSYVSMYFHVPYPHSLFPHGSDALTQCGPRA